MARLMARMNGVIGLIDSSLPYWSKILLILPICMFDDEAQDGNPKCSMNDDCDNGNNGDDMNGSNKNE